MMIVAFSRLTEVSRAQAIGNSQSRASAMTTPVSPAEQAGAPVLAGPYRPGGWSGAAAGLPAQRGGDGHSQTHSPALRTRASQTNDTIRMTTNRTNEAAEA